MLSYKASIHLKDTDATGVLYFTEQFRLALEAFEEFLKNSCFSLAEILKTSSFLMPIVHAEADYMAPLEVGDAIEIFPTLEHMGTSSFTMSYKFVKEGSEVGRVTLVHVTVSRETRKSIPIPEELLTLLSPVSGLKKLS